MRYELSGENGENEIEQVFLFVAIRRKSVRFVCILDIS